jgi:tetratricopeptide (TPR) repeat protein
MSDSYSSKIHACPITFFYIVLVLLTSCSIPRIIILNDPLSVEEHNKLGGIYETQRKYDLAAEQYREALKKDPKSIASLLLLGDLSFRMKNYPDAESAYKMAIKLQPGNGDIYNNMCWVYLEQHANTDKALTLIMKAMIVTPEHRAYYLDTMGVILLRTGKIRESVSALKEAVELLPKDNSAYLAEAYQHLSEAYRTAGDGINADEAARFAEKIHNMK